MARKSKEDVFRQHLSDMSKEYCIAMERSYGGLFGSYRTTTREAFNVPNSKTVRAGYGKDNYDYFRTHEEIPKSRRGRIALSMDVYEYIWIVRNLIDTMDDFTVQGIRITHPNPKVQKFFEKWAEKVDFKEVSSKIAKTLYRAANVPIQSKTGRIPIKKVGEWKRGQANFKDDKVSRREIPIHYELLNLLTIEVMNPEAPSNKRKYGQYLSKSLVDGIENNRHSPELRLGDSFYSRFGKRQQNLIPLDENNFQMLFYKKDDWEGFALPFVSAVLEQFSLLEKMRLADKSALDGAINQVRLWTLGVFEPIMLPPTPEAIRRLRSLLSGVGSGNIDMIWGPELSFKETTTQVHQFLGSDKYRQVMIEIYGGLGIPPTMTGTSNSSGSFTNTSIAMRTLVERLEYGRDIIVKFWQGEFKKICKAMGGKGIWSICPSVSFDYKVLSDERAEIELLLKLYDRHLVSDETVQELSRRDPLLEEARINREDKQRIKNKRPEKAGPWHNPRWEDEFKKILLNKGVVTPSELGLELLERDENEKTFLDLMNEGKIGINKKFKSDTGEEGGDGRPKGSKDKQKRKSKEVKPKEGVVANSEFVNLVFWATSAQEDISKTINNIVLEASSKKNIRSLSKKQYNEYESLKFYILSNLEPFSTVSQKTVYNIIESKKEENSDIIANAALLSSVFTNRYKREPVADERRQIQASAYAIMKAEELC